MKNSITKVTEFMQAFGQEVPFPGSYVDSPPPLEVRKLRAKLILEEAFETVNALGLMAMIRDDRGNIELQAGDIKLQEGYFNYNFIEVLDGLCDLEYVASAGTSVALGISEELYEKAFDLVHKNNMQKLWSYDELRDKWKNKEEAEKEGFKITMVKEGEIDEMDLYLVKDSNGKIIKSPSHKPVDLSVLLK